MGHSALPYIIADIRATELLIPVLDLALLGNLEAYPDACTPPVLISLPQGELCSRGDGVVIRAANSILMR